MARQRTPKEIEDEILSKLDIAREFENLGLKLATDKPTSKGWITSHAYGREDSTPSAAINLYTGCYKDHGGTHTTCGLFDFAVMTGRFTEWKEARHHFAVIAGIEKTLPRKDTTEERRPEDRIEIQPLWNPFMVRGLIAAYRGMSNESLMRADAKLCMWPKGRRIQEHCVALPIYGLQLTDNKPVGFIVMATNGGKLRPNAKSEEKKRLVIGETGLINRRGVAMIADRRAELVLKAEGVTDQQAIQTELCRPENADLIDRIAVVSNACGANETTLPREIAPVFSGIPTVILHDADEPGQDGAKLWKQEVGKFAPCVNLQLPYEIEPNHGKDSRDWINEGGTIRGLLEMVRQQFPGFLAAFDGVAAKPLNGRENRESELAPFDGNGHHRNGNNGNGELKNERVNHAGSVADLRENSQQGKQNPGRKESDGSDSAGMGAVVGLAGNGRLQEPEISEAAAILKRIGMIALGNPEGTDDIVGFCTHNGRTFTVKSVDYLRYERLLLHLGPEFKKHVNKDSNNEPDPTKLSMSAIRESIAEEGFKHRLTGASYFGVGVWELSGRLLIVNAGEATIVNGEVSRTTVPLIDGRIFDFGENRKWFDHDWFAEEFKRNSDREYSMSVLNEAIEVFSAWDNWKHSKTPEIIAALVCCTWVQNVWDWRPQACIIGSTNSGKTMLIRTLRGMFAQGEMSVGGMSPSAAGIRQKLKNTSKAVIVDEFEPHSKHRKECLEMFRGMSRGDSAPRGTSNQKGLDFVLKHLPWHGAIAADMKDAADRNRYLMIELMPVKAGRGSTLQVPSQERCSEIGLKLMAVSVKYWATSKDLANKIKKAYIEGVDRRLVESFSVPCGMISAILGLDEAEAVVLTRDVIAEQDLTEQSESDEQSLLRYIFESPVRLDGGREVTMSTLVNGQLGSAYGANDAMIRSGVKRFDAKDGIEWLFFVESSICNNLFRDPVKRGTGVAQILGRIEGAKKCRQYMGIQKPNGIAVPFSKVKELLGAIEGEEDQMPVDEIGKGANAEITGLQF